MPLKDAPYFLVSGVKNPLTVTYTDSSGVLPGAVTFTMAPQPGWDTDTVDIQLLFNRFDYTIADCKVLHVQENLGNHLTWQVNALDRRWKWTWGTISGHYNRWLESGNVFARTKKTPRELFTLLFRAVGETGVDVSRVPNKLQPECYWANALVISEIDNLLKLTGCRVVHNPDDTFAVMPTGEGDVLPVRDSLDTYTKGLSIPYGPAKIIAAFKRRHEVDVALKAMALEDDGRLVTLDDVSYKPDGGWDGQFPGEFSGVWQKTRSRFKQELARQSVWRYWQVRPRDLKGNKLKFPQYKGEAPEELEELLPLYAEGVAFQADLPGDDFFNFRLLPIVWGRHINGSLSTRLTRASDANNPANKAWEKGPFDVDLAVIQKIPFSLDTERGLFLFDEPVQAWDGDAKQFVTPKLSARVTVTLRDPTTLGEVFYEVERKRNVPAHGEKPRVILVDDTTADFWTADGKPADNLKLVKDIADHYLTQAEREYQYESPHTFTYLEWFPLQMNGAIVETTYTLTDQKASLTASYNNRHDFERPSYDHLRLITAQRGLLEQNQYTFKRANLKGLMERINRQSFLMGGNR